MPSFRFLGLHRLEIPQRRSKDWWKSLEKTGGILKKLGEKAWAFRGVAGASAVARSSHGDRARGRRPIANSLRAVSPSVGGFANFYLEQPRD